jgi:hypothetical protein
MALLPAAAEQGATISRNLPTRSRDCRSWLFRRNGARGNDLTQSPHTFARLLFVALLPEAAEQGATISRNLPTRSRDCRSWPFSPPQRSKGQPSHAISSHVRETVVRGPSPRRSGEKVAEGRMRGRGSCGEGQATFSKRRSFSISCPASNGLTRYSSAPSASARLRSSSLDSVEMTMIGMAL